MTHVHRFWPPKFSSGAGAGTPESVAPSSLYIRPRPVDDTLPATESSVSTDTKRAMTVRLSIALKHLQAVKRMSGARSFFPGAGLAMDGGALAVQRVSKR